MKLQNANYLIYLPTKEGWLTWQIHIRQNHAGNITCDILTIAARGGFCFATYIIRIIYVYSLGVHSVNCGVARLFCVLRSVTLTMSCFIKKDIQKQ